MRPRRIARIRAREEWLGHNGLNAVPVSSEEVRAFDTGFNMGWKALARRRPGQATAPKLRIDRIAEMAQEAGGE